MKSKFSTIFLLLPAQCCPFDHGAWQLKFEICSLWPLQNLMQISFSLITIWFFFKSASKLVFPNFIYKKLRKRETRAIFWKNWWNMSKAVWGVSSKIVSDKAFVFSVFSRNQEKTIYNSVSAKLSPTKSKKEKIIESTAIEKGCLVQVGNCIELEAVGLQFEPYRWLPCGVTWDSFRTVVVIKLLQTSALKVLVSDWLSAT